MIWIFWFLVACGGAPPPMTEAAPPPPPSAAKPAAEAGSAASEGEAVDDAIAAPRQVVWRATLAMVVEDVAATEAKAREIADALGGFVERSDVSPQGRYSHAELVLRVPSEGFQPGLDQLAALATEVTQRAVQAEDVTAELVDLDARIRNLEALEQRLQGLLAQTHSVAEALEVQRELTRVRTDIDQAKGRQKLIKRQVAMSTITVQLHRVPEAGPVEVSRWSPSDQVTRATEALLEGLQGLGTIAIWFMIAFLPLMLFAFGPPILFLRWLWRRSRAASPPDQPKA